MSQFKDLSPKKEIKEALLIFFIGGFLQEFVFDFREFITFEHTFRDICVNGTFWLLMWKGNQYLVIVIDGTGIKWQEQPGKRFVVSFFISVTYVLIVVFLIYVLIYGVIEGKSTQGIIDALHPSTFLITLFITLAATTFMHGKAFLEQWRMAAIRVEQLKIENISAKYDALKNQVNPHFLFNSLNSLSSLVYDDQDKAVEFIRKLSQVYRYVLDKKDNELVPVQEEIDFLNNFIFLQKIRFGDNLTIELVNDSENGSVPPLALQVLVENAIKHNVVSRDKPLHIKIVIDKDGCLVSNNLQERLQKDSTGIGLANLKARYEYLTKKAIRVTSNNHDFSVWIPILTFEKNNL